MNLDLFGVVMGPARFVLRIVRNVVFLGLFGIALIGGGLLIRHSSLPHAGEVQVEGVVTHTEVTEKVTFRDGKRVVSYDTEAFIDFTDPTSGRTYTTSTSNFIGSPPKVGDRREIAFAGDDPDNARVVDRGLAKLGLIASMVGGALVVIVGLLIVGGGLMGKKLLDGSRQQSLTPAWGQSPHSPLVAGVHQPITAHHPVPAPSHSWPGVAAPNLPTAAVAPTTCPAANWYPDPRDNTRLRYWDGARWTHHVSPR